MNFKILAFFIISYCSSLQNIINTYEIIINTKLERGDYQKFNINKPQVFLTLNDTNISLEYNGVKNNIELMDFILKGNIEEIYLKILKVLYSFKISESEKYLIIKNIYKADIGFPELGHFLRNINSILITYEEGFFKNNLLQSSLENFIHFIPIIYSDVMLSTNIFEAFYSPTNRKFYFNVLSGTYCYLFKVPVEDLKNLMEIERLKYKFYNLKQYEILSNIINFENEFTIEDLIILLLNENLLFIDQIPENTQKYFLNNGIGHYTNKKLMTPIFRHCSSCYKMLKELSTDKKSQELVFYVSANENTLLINDRKYTLNESDILGIKISPQTHLEIINFFSKLDKVIKNKDQRLEFYMRIILKNRNLGIIIGLVLIDHNSSDYIIFMHLMRMCKLITEEELIFLTETTIKSEMEKNVFNEYLIGISDRISPQVLENNTHIEYYYLQLFFFNVTDKLLKNLDNQPSKMLELIELKSSVEKLKEIETSSNLLQCNVIGNLLAGFVYYNRYLNRTTLDKFVFCQSYADCRGVFNKNQVTDECFYNVLEKIAQIEGNKMIE